MTIAAHTIAARMVSAEWALWVHVGYGSHAILMDDDQGNGVWIETDAGTAGSYGRQFGAYRVATIVRAHSIVKRPRVSLVKSYVR